MTDHVGGRAVAQERVVVTGIGVVSAIGRGVDEFTEALRTGRSGAATITSFDTEGFAHGRGCEVPEGAVARRPDDEAGRAAQFAVDAAGLALRDADLVTEDLRGSRTTIAIGTTDGESQDLDRLSASWAATGDGADFDRTLARRATPARLSSAVAQEFGLRDVDPITIATACSAGNYAIGYAYDAIRFGEARWGLAGGADALCRKTFTGFYRLGTIAPDVCRPFDADRQGILTGEGAAVLVLESLSAARARGARIYAEVLGYGLSCDAVHPVAPDSEGVARCIAKTLDNAGVDPGEVDLISAHGTGTRANDIAECAALGQVYGQQIPRTVSIKSMLGHAMGAASALGAAACAVALEGGFIPPTINHRVTDEECPIDCVPNESVDADLRVVQNNGLAFGGNNAIVMFAASPGPVPQNAH